MDEYLPVLILLGYIPLMRALNAIRINTTELEKNTFEMLEKMKKLDSLIEKLKNS